MTRPNQSALVLDGNDIKVRLMAERQAGNTLVHVDWLRFTVQARNSMSLDAYTPVFNRTDSVWDPEYREWLIRKVLAELPDCDSDRAAQALSLAGEVVQALGPGFAVNEQTKKGHDFYKWRFAIEREGAEVGWVGFGASSESPRQQAQAQTLHVNLYGAACTFAQAGWRFFMADLVEQVKGDITRCDLALDFFDGMGRDMKALEVEYHAGAFDHHGKRPKCRQVGDWFNGCERSLYIGSKEAGKQTNVYEKGDQLFGAEAGSPWVRVELRWGNKLRVLSTDMLRNPNAYFACASDWHQTMLAEAGAFVDDPLSVPCKPRLASETVEAEVTRNLRWAFQTAAPTIAAAFQYLGEEFIELVTNKRLPGRLQKFSSAELTRAFGDAIHRFTGADGDSQTIDGPYSMAI